MSLVIPETSQFTRAGLTIIPLHPALLWQPPAALAPACPALALCLVAPGSQGAHSTPVECTTLLQAAQTMAGQMIFSGGPHTCHIYFCSTETVPVNFDKVSESDPQTYEEAVEESEEWREAIKKELEAHNKFQTLITADPPDNVKPIETKWVFHTKPDGTKKARLVADGSQANRSEQVYAPVAKLPTTRLALSYSLQKDWFNQFATKNDLRRSSFVVCLYVGDNLWLVIWVDDILLMGEKVKIELLSAKLTEEFNAKYVGELLCFIGTELTIAEDRIELSQHKLIDKMLKRFNLQDLHLQWKTDLISAKQML
ncbi:hypothetical protein PR048_022251 [Dryococelus australis]|uniref:Reverse transcriptase Ty1/copia-type domain-containing protein n=1 Tax=Dryococelus australis TaxID=614101 RepID=A0ABQ9H0J3_9NEOP|nr:hypothetical protein PR048_022251 [Dryococelus australis]